MLMTERSGFVRSVAIQTRVIGALLMREIITRYGRHNIGFMWLFVEPMMFTVGVLTVWSLLNRHVTGLPLVSFTITGYSTVLLWRNTIGRGGNAIEPNRSLMHHRNVRVLDLFVARLLLEVTGASVSFMVLSSILILTDFMPMPDDLFKMIIAWLLLAWFSMCMGLAVGSLAAIFDPVDRIWHVLSYLFLPLSGAFYMVDWLPEAMQKMALYVPTVNCTELLREGYYGINVHAKYDLMYLISVNLTLTFIALAGVKAVSIKVRTNDQP